VIYELRQYTLRPGCRERLVDLFEREFVESQESLGAIVVGHFRDLDRPDMFVWVRGFADMEVRRRALTEFYDGPVWLAHRETANATMVDSDDVLLLHGDPLDLPRVEVEAVASTVVALIAPPGPGPAAALERIAATPGVRRIGTVRTEHSANNFPRLPIREGEDVVVSFVAYDGDEPAGFAEAVTVGASARVARLRLEPARRSRMR